MPLATATPCRRAERVLGRLGRLEWTLLSMLIALACLLYANSQPCEERQHEFSAAWAVEGQHKKNGSGLLFFAYGGRQLTHFLREANAAATSFRRLNPNIRIAIVSNARAVDNRVFDVHIQPREDLLFAGSVANGDWGDRMPRQWLTRLLYIAHSPFAITWVLDSNVLACTPMSAQAFLDSAEKSGLWGFDIAHANQRERFMYPHNFNLVVRWSPRSSALLRDWLLLQIRRGVASDDQRTLHYAEMRQSASGGLRVGQIRSEFAGAFYNAVKRREGNSSLNVRVSRVLQGAVHLLHTRDPSDCMRFNSHENETRQMLFFAVTHPGQRTKVTVTTLHSLDECERILGAGIGALSHRPTSGDDPKRIRCKFRDLGPRVTPTLHRQLKRAMDRTDVPAGARSSAATAIDDLLLPACEIARRENFANALSEAVAAIAWPPEEPACHNTGTWPPVFRPLLETLNQTRYFNAVEI